MLNKLVIILMLIIGTSLYCQTTENKIEANYTLVPSREETGSSRSEIFHNITVLFGDFNIENNIGMNFHKLSHTMGTAFDTEDLEAFSYFYNKSTLGYQFSKNWKAEVDAEISLATNLKGNLTDESFLLNGGLAFIHDFGTEDLPAYLKIGLGYYTFFGEPEILPSIYLYKRFSENVSMGIGFPKTAFTYHLTENNSLRANLEFNGIYANVHNTVNATSVISKMAWSSSATSLEFQHKLDNSWSFGLTMGYGFKNEYSFKVQTGMDNYQINNRSIFLGTGIIYNLNTK